jgi:DNA-binding SARP family transcriptional activator
MLRLNLLGSFCLDNGQFITISNRKAQALVAFLAVAPRGQSCTRERLAAMLWPDSPENAARQSLRQCVSVLRRNVPDLPLVNNHDRLALARKAMIIDVSEFEMLCADRSAGALKRVAGLYCGDLLEGFDARSDRFEAWLIEERIRLRTMAISALRSLLHYSMDKHPLDEAYGVAHRLLAIDPLQEDVHRALMRMHFNDGQATLALKQFKRCEIILRNELDIEPDAETRALYREHKSARARGSAERNGNTDAAVRSRFNLFGTNERRTSQTLIGDPS